MCSTPSSRASRTPCVPFPPPGGASMRTLTARAYRGNNSPCGYPPRCGVAGRIARGGRCPDDRRMSYRDRLPQLDGQLFLTDGGIETVLIFHEGLDLPAFAAFDLLKDEPGTEALRRYYAPYASLAASARARLRRREPDLARAPALGGRDRLRRGRARRLQPARDRADGGAARTYERPGAPVVISGCVGPQRRRLQPVDELLTRRRGRGLPLDPDRDLRRHRGRHGHRDHDDLRRGGDRRRPGRRSAPACRS